MIKNIAEIMSIFFKLPEEMPEFDGFHATIYVINQAIKLSDTSEKIKPANFYSRQNIP